MNVLVSRRQAVRLFAVGSVAAALGFVFSDVAVPSAAAQQSCVQQGGRQRGWDRDCEDFARGYDDGFLAGLRAGRRGEYHDATNNPGRGNTAYREGFRQGYQDGYDQGRRESKRRPK